MLCGAGEVVVNGERVMGACTGAVGLVLNNIAA